MRAGGDGKKETKNSSPGRLELPTSWLTVRRANQLRHGDLLVEVAAISLISIATFVFCERLSTSFGPKQNGMKVKGCYHWVRHTTAIYGAMIRNIEQIANRTGCRGSSLQHITRHIWNIYLLISLSNRLKVMGLGPYTLFLILSLLFMPMPVSQVSWGVGMPVIHCQKTDWVMKHLHPTSVHTCGLYFYPLSVRPITSCLDYRFRFQKEYSGLTSTRCETYFISAPELDVSGEILLDTHASPRFVSCRWRTESLWFADFANKFVIEDNFREN